MKNYNKTAYLVLFLGIVSVLLIIISAFGRAYAFYTSFYTSPGWNVVGEEPYAMFVNGHNFRDALISLNSTGGKAINTIERSSTAPSGVTTITVNTENSTVPILMWQSGDTVYYYSPASTIYLNPDSSYMFEDSAAYIGPLTNINTTGWDTSGVTTMAYMFDSASTNFATTTINTWDVGNVTNMHGIFLSSGTASSLNLGSWNTHKVTDMSHMFSSSAFTSINVSKFNTIKVANMDYMFSNMFKLNQIGTTVGTINLSQWNVNNVTNMHNMFENTNSTTLRNFNLQSWNTYKVKDMSYMFYNSKAYYFYTNSWVTNNVTNTYRMFYSTSSLVHVNMFSWHLVNLSNNTQMFTSSNLKNFYSPASIKAGINIALPYPVKYTGTSYSKLNSTTPKSVLFKYS